MSFSHRILMLVIGISCVAVTSEIVSQQPQKHTDWSVSIAKTKMKTMTAEQQAAYVSSLELEQQKTFCEKFPCAPGCGRTFCQCFPGAPWCSVADRQTGTSAEWSVSIAKTKMKTMTAEQQAAYVSSVELEQQKTFCEKFPCAPGCGRTFCECFPGAPWCSEANSVHLFPISAQDKAVLNEQAWACIRPDLHR